MVLIMSTKNKDGKTTAGVLYGKLPKAVQRSVLDVGETQPNQRANIKSFLNEHVAVNKLEESSVDNLQYKAQALENTTKQKRKATTKQPRHKTLSCRQKRKQRLFDIQPDAQRYELYLPLHRLWTDYVKDLLQLDRLSSNVQQLEERLLKADLHGSHLTVTRTGCPSLLGISGIVLQETRRTIRIISQDNKLRMIPKENSVFSVTVGDFVLAIYGNNFCYKSSERASHKFKAASSIVL